MRPIVPYLPTKVINIGKSDQDIRLHISSPEQASYYTTLSHSWGEQTPVRTILSRLNEYTVHIPTPLPQTFADAISITRALDIPYVRIDALRIVQDFKIYWIHEAREMATTYINSFWRSLPMQQQTAPQAFSTIQLGLPPLRSQNLTL